MPIEKLKPIHVFVPFTRVDEEKREVEAYGFTQEVVEGEGGMRLKRTSMEEATPDYMAWANIRRMHTADAVGVAKSVEWDATGAKMILEIVDDDAWDKVKKRVYKGLSVGVNALTVRGKDVEKCRWFETSLVDRPKDPGAKILAFRAEGAEEEADCEVIEEHVLYVRSDELPTLDGMLLTDAIELIRTATSSDVPTRENLEGKAKGETHYPCNSEYGCHGHTTRGGAQECQDKDAKDKDAHIAYHQDAIKNLKEKRAVESGEIERSFTLTMPLVWTEEECDRFIRKAESELTAAPPPLQTEEEISRIAALTTEAALLLTRAETAESDLAIERTALVAAKERIVELEKLPMPGQTPPVRFTQALERTFAANEADPLRRQQDEAMTELLRLKELCKAEPDSAKQQAIIARMMTLEKMSGIPMP